MEFENFISGEICLPDNPVFVVGYPRSGTTLLQSLIATQESVITFPETHFFNVIEKKLFFDSCGQVSGDSLSSAFTAIYEKTEILFTVQEQKEIVKLVAEYSMGAKALFELLVYRLIGSRIPANPKSWRWLEKTPNHVYFLDRILSMYPKARFVNIVRNPVAAILSRKQKFPFNKETPIEALAAMWRRAVSEAANFETKVPQQILTVRYEELASDVVGVMRCVAGFLELDFRADLLENFSRVVDSCILPFEVWKEDVCRQSITRNNDTYVNNKLVSEDVRLIQSLLKEEIEACGFKFF